jgi:hypothetical protein
MPLGFHFVGRQTEEPGVIILDKDSFCDLPGRTIALSKHRAAIDDLIILWESGETGNPSERSLRMGIRKISRLKITRKTLKYYFRNYFYKQLSEEYRNNRLEQLRKSKEIQAHVLDDTSERITDDDSGEIGYLKKLLAKLEKLAQQEYNIAGVGGEIRGRRNSIQNLTSLVSTIMEIKEKLYQRTAGLEIPSLVEKIAGDVSETSIGVFAPHLPKVIKEKILEEFANKVMIQSEVIISGFGLGSKTQSQMRKESKTAEISGEGV